jgi:hypothetical protein
MIREGTVALDSIRLARYAQQVPCFICEEGNSFDAELCRHCFAPMALGLHAEVLKTPPRMIATIGASGVGKTVYLGMLINMLARQPERLPLLPRGAFSVSLPHLTISALPRGEFPNKTPNEPDRWNWAHCQVRSPHHKQPLDLIMPDMSGDALMEEVDHPHSYKVIRSFLAKAAGVMILIDALQLHSGTLDQDFISMKLLGYLAELAQDATNRHARRPLSVVFTKADECEECLLDPTAYAQAHAPGLWRQCHERFHNFRFYSAGVAGGCVYRLGREGRVRVPLRVEPRGIVEPFEWLVSQLKNK